MKTIHFRIAAYLALMAFALSAQTIGSEIAVALILSILSLDLYQLVRVQVTNSPDITRKHAQEALLKREKGSDTALPDFGSEIAVIDRAGTILAVNEPWRRFSLGNGCTDMSLTDVGTNYLSVFEGNLDPEMRVAYDGILSVLNADVDHFTHVYPCDSPLQKRWYMMSVSPYGEHAAQGLLITHTDITDHRRSESVLKKSEENLLIAQQIGGVGSYILDLIQDQWIGTKVLNEMYGIDENFPRDFNGWLEIVHPDDRDLCTAHFQNAITQKIDFNLKFRIIRVNDGALRYLHGLGRIEYADSGEALRLKGTTQDITNQALTDQHLENVLYEQNVLLDNDLVGIAKLKDRHIVWANTALENMFGFVKGGLNGLLTREFYVDDEAFAHFGELCFPVFNAGKNFRIEFEFRRKDGSIFWADLSGTLLDPQNGITVWYFIDVTARKVADNALRLKESALSDAQRIGGLGSYSIDTTTGMWTSSPMLDKLFGIDANYVRNLQGYAQIIHPDDREELLAYWQYVVDTGTKFDREYRIVRVNDGAVRWMHGQGKNIQDENGKTIFQLGTDQDITERVLKNQSLEQLIAEQNVLLDNELVGIAKLKDRHVVWANTALEKMAGVGKGGMNGVPTRKYHVSDEALTDLETRSYPTLKAGKVFRTLFEYQRDNGSSFWADLSGAVVRPGTTLWCFTDVTESVLDKERLANAKADADEANQAKSQFLSNMSHELRTPMNGILGVAQLLAKPHIDDATRIEYAGLLFDSGNALLALLNDILDLSKIEAKKFELELGPFKPFQIISDTTNLFNEAAKVKGLRLVAGDFAQFAQRYLGDANRLRQMLMNLVGNAIKFTASGTVRIDACEIERDETSAYIEFSVSDTGIGIAKNTQEKLFKPFTQVDNSTTREFGGTGLGLSITRELAQLMDGEVGLESQQNQGSRFWFRVRVGLDAEGTRLIASPAAHMTDEAESAPSQQLLNQGHRILVVDDNALNGLILLEMLALLGYDQATQLADGRKAVDAITSGDKFDLILMDLHMPVLGGYEATQEIRAWEAMYGTPRSRIVALTADASELVHQRCLSGGMDELLTKPVLINQLQEMLARWLPA